MCELYQHTHNFATCRAHVSREQHTFPQICMPNHQIVTCHCLDLALTPLEAPLSVLHRILTLHGTKHLGVVDRVWEDLTFHGCMIVRVVAIFVYDIALLCLLWHDVVCFA